MTVFFKLILAHLVGDFLLQPSSWVKAKEQQKLRAWQLYVHAGVHGALSWLLIWDVSFWKWALLIALVHFAIDSAKVVFQTENTRRTWFLTDQMLHVVSLCLIASWFQAVSPTSVFSSLENHLGLLTLVLFLTKPASIFIKTVISKWTPQDNDTESLENAGKYIGILERMFVFIFIVTNHWEGVGFLLAAKSIFRFGDLKEPKHRNLTEYVMIGTMLSFGIAVLTGFLYTALLQ